MTHQWMLWMPIVGLLGCNKVAAKTPEEAKQLLHRTGCTNCHDKERPLVGPPFAEIASRYATQKDAEKILAESLTKGSRGKWGPTPMPAQPRLEPEDQQAMIAWILNLAAKR